MSSTAVGGTAVTELTTLLRIQRYVFSAVSEQGGRFEGDLAEVMDRLNAHSATGSGPERYNCPSS